MPRNTRTQRQPWAEAAERAGVRLEDIACLTGLSYPAVYNYARGFRSPPPGLIGLIEALLAFRTSVARIDVEGNPE